MQCPACGANCDAQDSFCRKCGASLQVSSPEQRESQPPSQEPPRPSPPVSVRAVGAARARPVGPAPGDLLPEGEGPTLSLAQLIRPIASGVAVCVLIGLFYITMGVYVSHTYTPLIQFHERVQGLIWLALFGVGCAWASRDERENSFLTGALSGLISGFLLSLAEILFLSAPFCLRYVLGATLAAGAVGLLSGTLAGIIGSPVMVRFPTAQKRWALSLVIAGVIPAVVISALPPQNEVFHSRMARAYYHRQMFLPAARHFEKALQLKPFDASINSDLAVCLAQIGDREASLRLLQKAVAVDRLNRRREPDYLPVPEPYKNLAISLYIEGMQLGDRERIQASAELFAEYIQLVPDAEIQVFYDLLNAYLQLDQPAQALQVAEQAAQLYPENQALQEQLPELRRLVQEESPSDQEALPPAPQDQGEPEP